MSATMVAGPSTSTSSSSANLFARPDTSICSHLSSLLSSPSHSSQHTLGTQDGSNASVPPPATAMRKHEVEKRFTEAVRWGALAEGAKRRKTTPPQCHTCSTTLTRPWACLTCSYIGCLPFTGVFSSSSKNCMRNHWQQSNGQCGFAVDPSSGAIYCSSCSDTIYPDQFESILRVVKIRTEEMHDKSREPGAVGGGRGRGRGPWKAWNPSNMVKIEESEVAKSSCRGLRPLLNLSQTCFLSAILQSLIHNPLLKAYFLSDKHNRHVCPNGSKGLSVGKPFLGAEAPNGAPGIDREKGCMCCEMDRAFEEFYNEDNSPYGPITMLYAMWHASAELEGYGQQDAHSFFLAALDQIHAHAKGQLSSCNCIAHQTFAGSLLSSVTCSSCSHTSSTIDPILDIQLDFPYSPLSGSSTATITSNASTSSSEGIGGGSNGNSQLTLAGLLRRFCASETIGGSDSGGKGYECSKCGGGPGTHATKNLTIKKLAPVLSFQLKRFAHMTTSSSKIETHVRFPSTLDMRPYVDTPSPPGSASASQSTGEDIKPTIREEQDILPDSLFMYDLFAVVTHEGKLDNGHYWADVREGEEWWHCDDDKVTPTTLSSVLSQKAYMLFYVKRSLAYAQPMSKLLGTTASTTSLPTLNNISSNI
ncbi:ubiquitin carboxyl-terminal hydrolase 22/27/51 [Kwoniella mangroviensis CBS 10435]|uniref:Ubiquitin carboxyl-terminal hydrolase 22/27/51 n=1 Tax=Kwoniella mangroviensis CBS 10435 TaxID=1331196 RepID=A0A1B9IXN9_9TREE|nr:ubiquitin carboxyl-terminal hydrolase 22/27/51 [Kwoniella mangroviensis CBS 8507]OCF60293.1 ubiquitin carboxyl-terminal hydrolase 22/27/51 [Kwoniella mangroviensis CBS 10435]OCF69333.1 ubiquitin carboxyl-terminal hydrolase 22/27/51 [Kwoniella mangroviensis CBS 8507]OCF72459.1 ubiquitin carboxyl-terminal hydrolase 22/27/51 [Kwoniella mangroviensis CBS 8886]